jgi:predicted DNA-binding transcriptional regulator AlpA
MEQAVVTVAEAVQITRLSQARLYQLFADGTLDYVHVGRRRLVKIDSIRRLLKMPEAA